MVLPLPVNCCPPHSQLESSSTKEQGQYETKAYGLTDILLAIFSGFLALLTFFLVIVGFKQAKATRLAAEAALKTAKSLITSERAYLKMSHTEDGLLIWDNPTVRMCEVTVKVENCGRTPASVTDVRLNTCVLEWDEPWPTIPDYGQQSPDSVPNAFLVPEDSFYLTRTFTLGRKDLPNPRTGEKRLCLFGYIDYIDVFGRRHRAGYGREYVSNRTGNNLVFASQPGYNYDRLRQQGEGDD